MMSTRAPWQSSAGDAEWVNRGRRQALALVVTLFVVAATPLAAYLDLARAEIEQLDNGLTLVVLEDATLPVVSVQMLYRVGARNEQVGRTGLAHYLEHMAFRATESFPDTEVVSSIYAVGGEWHGYTWIDQTTYFETVPREHLDLVLRIEADRMGSLLIPAAEVEAERGAVLAELHGYENDPGTVLLDTVVATSFLQHPYRHNTIGWESDVEKIEHADLVDFYRRFYRPANAVLAVVGDVVADEVRRSVRRYFGSAGRTAATAAVRTVEPRQRGERRVRIEGAGGRQLFMVAYRAPAVGSPEWPAFLVLQEILGGGEGVNFLQNEWGVPVRADTRLADVVDDLSTWYPPAASPYVFVIGGSIPDDDSISAVEERLEERIEILRRRLVGAEELAAARERLQEHLVFDLQTTEDAAHQLASYVGYDALPQLLELRGAVERVTAAAIQRLVTAYLQPQLRTIGWTVPGGSLEPVETEDLEPMPMRGGEGRGDATGSRQARKGPITEPSPTSPVRGRVETPLERYLSSGLPVLFQRVPLSPTAHLRLLVPENRLEFAGDSSRDRPIWGWTSLDRELLVDDLEAAAAEVRQSFGSATLGQSIHVPNIEDPGERLEAAFEEVLGVVRGPVVRQPAVLVLVGDLEARQALETLERHFGDLQPAPRRAAKPLVLRSDTFDVRVPLPRAQAQLGYVVPAPPPGLGDALTWRVLLYILTHGYEGRLGKEAISRRGLVYYVDSSYRSDGRSAWIGLGIGVDPSKLGAVRQLLLDTLQGLERRPPTEAEVEEARNHLIGRWRSAAQSNEEISTQLLRQWVGTYDLRTEAEFAAAVRAVSRADVLRAIPEFTKGAVIAVEVPE